MGMHMMVGIMGGALTEMTMNVKMVPTVGMPVAMKMKTATPQANEYVPAQQYQHHADDTFQHLGQGFTEAQIQKDSRTSEEQQGQRMAQAPNRAMGGDPANGSRAGAKRRYGRHVISLQGMLHADQKPEQKNAIHKADP